MMLFLDGLNLKMGGKKIYVYKSEEVTKDEQ